MNTKRIRSPINNEDQVSRSERRINKIDDILSSGIQNNQALKNERAILSEFITFLKYKR